jgi:hypothetical protein
MTERVSNECQASLSGMCLVMVEGDVVCAIEDGECVRAGIPAQEEKDMDQPLHRATGDEPMRSEYVYAANGVGVRKDLVDAVLARWTVISPTGDPATTLRSVNDGMLNSIDNLAQISATAVAEALEGTPE